MISINYLKFIILPIILFVVYKRNTNKEHFGPVKDCAISVGRGIWDQLKFITKLIHLPKIIKTFIQNIGGFFGNLRRAINNIRNMPNRILNSTKRAVKKIERAIRSIPQKLKAIIEKVKKILLKIKTKMINKVKSMELNIKKSIKQIKQFVKDFRSNIIKYFKKVLKALISLPKRVIIAIWKALKTMLDPLGRFFKNNKMLTYGLIILLVVMFIPIVIKIIQNLRAGKSAPVVEAE